MLLLTGNGAFSINAPKGAVLVFSFIGYAKKEVTITDSQPLAVTLESDNRQLDQVVVIGYGTREKKDLTGSVSTVSSSQVKDLPVSSIDQKLIGQMPGVQISSTTGAPGVVPL